MLLHHSQRGVRNSSQFLLQNYSLVRFFALKLQHRLQPRHSGQEISEKEGGGGWEGGQRFLFLFPKA
jgi:hypothetical protein